MMENGKADRASVGRPTKNGSAANPFPTLRDGDISKRLADQARKLYGLPLKEFKVFIIDGRADVERSIERTTFAAMRRRNRHRNIFGAARLKLEHFGPFPLIYADPPWKWDHFGQKGNENEKGKDRTPDQHYPTLTYDNIKNFEIDGKSIKQLAHKDSVLFLWCTSANLVQALEVMAAWDFEYKTHAVWVKDRSGLGLVFRNKHELLLYGTRGRMPGPLHQPPSVFPYPRGKHSAKPPEVRTTIEKMYPVLDETTRLELFARGRIEGWSCYGLES
jgi:N6-adenosine-specific RNA methylase IME4